MMAESGWLFKVLAGSHAGTELELNESEYLLGSDEQCDLVFSGQDIVARAVQIQLHEDNVLVKRLALDQPATIDGKEVKDAELRLEAFQVFAVGALRFALAPIGLPWPELDSARLADAPVADEANAEPPPEKATSDEAAPPPQLAQRSNRRLGRQRQRWLRWSSVVVFLLVSGFVIHANWSSFQFFQPQQREVQPHDPVKEVKKIIDALKFDIQIGVNADGRLHLRGYLADDEEKKLFLSRIEKLNNAQLLIDIKTFADIKRATERVLSSYLSEQDRIEVAHGDRLDRLFLSGYVVDENHWHQALIAIRKDVPDVKFIDDQVETIGKRLRRLREMLLSHGLEQILFPQVTDGRIMLDGHLPEDRFSDWERLSNEFNELYRGMPQLVLVAEATAGSADWLNSFQVESVSFGRVPYFVLQGQKYIVGSRLDNGYFVEHIGEDSIRFQSGERRYTYYFGGQEHEQENK